MPKNKKDVTSPGQSTLKNAMPKAARRRRRYSSLIGLDSTSAVPPRIEREQRTRRLILAVSAAVGMIVIGVIFIGYYLTNIAPPREVVAEFYENQITADDVKKQMKIQSSQAILNNNFEGLNFNPGDILNAMAQTAITRFYSNELGLKADYNQVEQEILSRLIPEFEQRKTEEEFTQLQEEFKRTLIEFVELLKIDEEYYREVLAGQILLGDSFTYFANKVPQENEEVFAYWIKASTKNKVEEVRQKLLDGEEFKDVARDYNEDITHAAEDGEIGWVPRGAFPEIETVLFNSQLNSVEEITITDVYTGRDATYFILLTDGPELRTISDEMRVLVSKNLYFDWFSIKQIESGFNILLTEKSSTWINAEVSEFLLDAMPQLEELIVGSSQDEE